VCSAYEVYALLAPALLPDNGPDLGKYIILASISGLFSGVILALAISARSKQIIYRSRIVLVASTFVPLFFLFFLAKRGYYSESCAFVKIEENCFEKTFDVYVHIAAKSRKCFASEPYSNLK